MLDRLTEKIAEQIFLEADRRYNELRNKKHLMVRWGQTLYNTADEFIMKNGNDKLIDAFQFLKENQNTDCFYDDSKTSAFYEALKALGA